MSDQSRRFRRWESIFLETSQPVLVHDGNGRLLYGNLEFARFAGLEEEIGAWAGSAAFPSEGLDLLDGDGVVLDAHAWLSGLNPEASATRLMRRKDGTGGWLRFHSFHTAEETGSSHMIVAVGLGTAAPAGAPKAEAEEVAAE